LRRDVLVYARAMRCFRVLRFALPVTVAALSLAVSAALPDGSAHACAAVGPRGPIFVRGEEALIVWDPERQIEHFIRRALFRGVSDDFGFLVPTPSRPELAEVPSRVFDDLFKLYRRPPARSAPMGRMAARAGSGGGGVRVLEERTVAGMDAAVLEASSAGALDGWLREHGYPNSPELQEYAAPYVAARWIITAFRVSGSRSAGVPFSTSAVRMSFSTERPFFPYSEPQHRAPARHFRVSVVAPARMRAVLDAPAGGARTEWRGAAYAGRPARLHSAVARVLPPGVRAGAWLTTFDEPVSRRGRLDLFFEPDPEQTPLRSRISARIVASF
jgi:hypothetical protein